MAQEFKRWYDFDPELLKLINILKDYQTELREQAEVFLESIESKVSKETLDMFYEQTKPLNGGNRWYDKDPVISKTIELIRVIPTKVQRQTAQNFLEALKANGISLED